MVFLEMEASRIPDVLVHACQTLVYDALANEFFVPNFAHIEEVLLHLCESLLDDVIHRVQLFVAKD